MKKTELYCNSDGKFVMQEPYYDELNQTIFMDEREDDYEYAETWKHEVGHFIDHQMGYPSHNEQLEFAKDADLEWFIRKVGDELMAEMLNELRDSSAMDNRYVSDILSGLFYDKSRIRHAIEETYNDLGVAMYGHEDAYWNEIEGPQKAIEGELFADLFAIYTENNFDTVRFVEKWFPNITNRFKNLLKG